MCSTSACAPSAISRHGGRFTPNGTHSKCRSPAGTGALSCVRAQISQKIFTVFRALPSRAALFCLPPSKVIYQLYPTANVFAQLIYQFIKQRYRHFFTCCIQHYTVNFAKSYKTIAILEVLPHSLGPFLCNLSNYADCIFFRSKFIHFGNAVKSPQITRAIFVRFCPYHFNLHLSFPIPFCYHICIQRALCRKARLDVFDLLGGEQQ